MIRVVVPDPDEHVVSVAAHIRTAQAKAVVLCVTANRPYAHLNARFGKEAVDVAAIHYLDAVSSLDGQEPMERIPNAMFVRSPTMLEMIAMRAEQWVARQDGACLVLLDSLNSLALYNGVEPVTEFCHYLANRLRGHEADLDFVVLANAEGRDLEDRLSSFTDARQELAKKLA